MNKKSFVRRSAPVATAFALLSATAAIAAPQAVDPAVRLQLVRSAADKADLHEVGLDFRDVYGVISAETSWVPRPGMGKNGVVSRGLAQFEPATARAVGLKDPDNAVEAVHAAARLLREAAVWSAQRIARLGLSPEQRAAKLREGISIYYNLSTRARSSWSGQNTATLPVETLRHIHNVRQGALQAERLNARMGGPNVAPLATGGPVLASMERSPAPLAAAKPAALRVVGTIEWASKGRYEVLSNGEMRRARGG